MKLACSSLTLSGVKETFRQSRVRNEIAAGLPIAGVEEPSVRHAYRLEFQLDFRFY